MMPDMKVTLFVITLGCALGLATVVSALESAEMRVGTGVDISRGSYGESEDTEIISIPFLARFEQFPWTLRATVPWTQIKGPEDVIAGSDGPVAAGTSTQITTDSGIGDLVLAGMYSIDPWSKGAPAVDLTAKVKVPTADEEKRLGTGKTDYSLQADLTRAINAWSPFLTLGYQFMGSSDDLPLDDRAYGSIGVTIRASSKLSGGAAYDFRQAASDRSDDSHEVGVFGTWRVKPSWRLSAYASVGLSDGAPDWNIGLQTQVSVWK